MHYTRLLLDVLLKSISIFGIFKVELTDDGALSLTISL